MREQIIQEINDSLNHMEETGKVDLSILDNLKQLRKFLCEIKTKWLEHPSTDAFYFYQAARNVELILGKMEDRFEKSQIMNDNPKVAADSLILMPQIDTVLKMSEENIISEYTINIILEKTRKLRNVAADRNLIESLEIDRDSIDKDNLRYRFTQLMDKLNIKSDDHYRVVDD